MCKGPKTGALSGPTAYQLTQYFSKRVLADRKPNIEALMEKDPAVEAIVAELLRDDDDDEERLPGEKGAARLSRRQVAASEVDELVLGADEGEDEETEDEGGDQGEEKDETKGEGEEEMEEEDEEVEGESDDMDTEEDGGVPLGGSHSLPFRPSPFIRQ